MFLYSFLSFIKGLLNLLLLMLQSFVEPLQYSIKFLDNNSRSFEVSPSSSSAELVRRGNRTASNLLVFRLMILNYYIQRVKTLELFRLKV